ncbi:hypothetical protein GUJ93_ZPchr0009g809 [Zizania palustris]|uniref:Uncharacterized protein n=1 Tax=Zizania palustris TaxID=103762 RepID=A0A8J5V2D3_ZIZPA|nr:hypothetical protein GUJ93_ZPchr0009g809 [Zizania palustris]
MCAPAPATFVLAMPPTTTAGHRLPLAARRPPCCPPPPPTHVADRGAQPTTPHHAHKPPAVGCRPCLQPPLAADRCHPSRCPAAAATASVGAH